ncbi:MAG: P-II family nitrogen regulator [Candidatus Schekmanbacteria bacterium]|nr:P-II family nitrogen regulator [Candidatus Schekmanbacteria bacterium]
MKLITAIIRPERLEAVQQELQNVLDEEGHYRLTVRPVEGHGRQEGEVEVYRGQSVRSSLHEKLEISLGVNDAYVEKTIAAIIRGARTGQIGDGKIFITPLEDCVWIRTGERGSKAI